MVFPPHVPEVVTSVAMVGEIDDVGVQCPEIGHLLYRDRQHPETAVLGTVHCICVAVVYLWLDILSPRVDSRSCVYPLTTATTASASTAD